MSQLPRLRSSRRTLLQSLGLTSASLMLPSLLDRRAERAFAQSGYPKRIVIYSTNHGTVYNSWKMRFGGQSETAGWEKPLAGAAESDFSPILKQFYEFRDQMLVVDGLAQHTALNDPADPNEHQKGMITSLTGMPTSGTRSNGPSVDRIIAKANAGLYPSLELTVGGYGPWSAIYDQSGAPVSAEAEPGAIYDRLFPGGKLPGGGTGTPPPQGGSTGTSPPPAPSDADRIAALQRNVVDLARSEYDRVLPRLSKADQQKLSNHRDLVRDLQSRLVALSGSNTGTSPGPAVTLPAASAASCSGTQPRPTASQNTPGYADRWNAFIPMMTVALACDLTRVISMQGGGPGNSEAGLPAGDIHQDYAHHVDENPTAFAAMTTYHTYNGKMLLNLLRSLASVKEGNGTLLDNTLVVWEGELATGEHHFYTWPAVIFGGRNLGLATGRYVHLEQNVTAKLPYGGGTTRLGPGHNRLLVSLARLMGVSTNTVGLANVSGSVSSVDLSGPLPGIGG